MNIKSINLICLCDEDEDDFVGLAVKIPNPLKPTDDLLLRCTLAIINNPDGFILCEVFDPAENEFVQLMTEDKFAQVTERLMNDHMFGDHFKKNPPKMNPLVKALQPYINVLRSDVLHQALGDYSLKPLAGIIHVLQRDENEITFDSAMYVLKKLISDGITEVDAYIGNCDDEDSKIITEKIRRYYTEWKEQS